MIRHGSPELFAGKCFIRHSGHVFVKPSKPGRRWYYELELFGIFFGIQGVSK